MFDIWTSALWRPATSKPIARVDDEEVARLIVRALNHYDNEVGAGFTAWYTQGDDPTPIYFGTQAEDDAYNAAHPLPHTQQRQMQSPPSHNLVIDK